MTRMSSRGREPARRVMHTRSGAGRRRACCAASIVALLGCAAPMNAPDAGDAWVLVRIDPAPGEFGARCVHNTECHSGVCSGVSRRCTRTCQSCADCPRGDDWTCGLFCHCVPQFGGEESCGNHVDDDCDGLADEGCPVEGVDPARPVTEDCDGGCPEGWVCRERRCRC